MKSTRGITIGLTFIAGLYFILDFVVPPTLPGASIKGVVASITPATFILQSGPLPPVAYRLTDQGVLHPKLLVERRDTSGIPKLVSTHLRQVSRGSTISVREGPFTVKNVTPGANPTIVTTESQAIALSSGQIWIDGSTKAPVNQPAAGMSLSIEQTGMIISEDPGAVVLLINSQRVAHFLGDKTAVVKAARFGQGSEVGLDELQVGDTAQFGPATTFADNRDTAAQFNLVITTMAFGIALMSLGGLHGKLILKRAPGWYVSLFFFAAVALGIVAGLGKYNDPGTASRNFSDFVVLRIIASATSTVFSLLAFYMASAAYRAFRIRNGEAALMMASALIVMLGQTPFGFYLTGWMPERFSAFWLPNIAAWILRVPNTAMFRGLIFGIMLGAIATALRYWLSMERSVTSGD